MYFKHLHRVRLLSCLSLSMPFSVPSLTSTLGGIGGGSPEGSLGGRRVHVHARSGILAKQRQKLLSEHVPLLFRQRCEPPSVYDDLRGRHLERWLGLGRLGVQQGVFARDAKCGALLFHSPNGPAVGQRTPYPRCYAFADLLVSLGTFASPRITI